MAVGVEKIARAALKGVLEYRYHHRHKVVATRILQSIESVKGKTALRDIKLSDEYADSVLGGRHFAPWLYVYSAIAGGFKEGWIPDNYYGSIVVPKLKGEYGKVSNLKPLNSTIFENQVFPDILSYANGVFFDSQYRVVLPTDVEHLLFESNERVIYKLDNSSQGRGIHIFDRHSFDVEQVRRLGNGLFQTFIRQHPAFDEFGSDAVATLRMTTVIDETGDVSLRACYLRLGLKGETHVQSRSNIRVAVDLQTGALSDIGFTVSWVESPIHPSTKVAFSGKQVPRFGECKDVVTKLHKKVPYVRCIGWDVTVDSNENVKIMEWNGTHNDIKFSEATQGPCFADLGWVTLAKSASVPITITVSVK